MTLAKEPNSLSQRTSAMDSSLESKDQRLFAGICLRLPSTSGRILAETSWQLLCKRLNLSKQ